MTKARTAPYPVGEVLAGKYRLTAIIGKGGMGTVYAAENILIGRSVAIKVLHAELAGDPQLLIRFRQEARAAAAIGHPGIIDVLDLGEAENGSAFIVMEYLDGRSLGDVLKETPQLTTKHVVEIARGCLAALAAAHDAQVIHRDLKPDNIFLTAGPAPAVKLLDFGISKLRSDENATVTTTGVILGTPLYMSPEQARGDKALSNATDIYSLGAVIYHMITGRPPFVGDNYSAVLSQVLFDPPTPPEALVANLPGPLSTLVISMLCKQPIGRPQSAADAMRALDELGATVGDPEPPRAEPAMGLGTAPTLAARATPRPAVEPAQATSPTSSARTPARRTVLAFTAATVLAVALGGVWLLGHSSSSTADPQAPTLETLAADGELSQLRTRAESSLLANVAADGELAKHTVEAVSRIGAPALAPVLYAALDASPETRLLAARSLSEMAPVDAIERLRPYAEASGGQLRIELTACLAGLGDPSSIALLQRMQIDRAHLRLVAALALARGGAGDKARATLQDVFANAERGSDRWRRAGDGLILLGDADARQQLATELDDSDPRRVVEAATILARHHDRSAIDRLRALAADPHEATRSEAALALAGERDEVALAFARDAIGSSEPGLRSAAIAVVARLARTNREGFLLDITRMATRDPSAIVRATATAALAAMGEQQ